MQFTAEIENIYKWLLSNNLNNLTKQMLQFLLSYNTNVEVYSDDWHIKRANI